MESSKKFNIDKLLSISLGIIIFLVMLFILYGYFQSERNKEFNKHLQSNSLNENWVYELDGKEYNIDFPNKIKCKYNSFVGIKNVIPLDFIDGNYIYIHTSSCPLDAYIGGEKIEVVGIATTKENKQYENPITVLIIPNGSQGKELTINILNNGSKFDIEVFRILYGEKNEIRFDLTSSLIPIICMVVVMVSLAIMLIIYALVIYKKYPNNSNDYICLSAFIIFSAIWIFTDLSIQGAYFVGSESHYFAKIISYLLIPIPLMMFINKQLEKRSKLLRMLTLTQMIFVLITMFFFAVKIFKLACVLLVSHVLTSIYIIVMASIIIKKIFIDKKKDINILFYALVIFGITGTATMLNFYVNVSGDNTFLYKYGIAIFIVLTSIHAFLRGFRNMTNEKTIEATYMLNEEVNIINSQRSAFVCKYYIEDNMIVYNEDEEENRISPQDFVKSNINDKYEKDFLDLFYNIKQGILKGSVGFEGIIFNKKGYYELSYELVSNKNNKYVYALLNINNRTQAHKLEKILNEACTQARNVVNRGGSFFEYNLTNDEMILVENNLFDKYLKKSAKLKEFNEYIEEYIINDSDKSMFELMFSFSKLYSIYGRDASQSFELKLRIKDNEKWVRFIIDCYTASSQKEVIVLIQVQDIENEKKYVVDSISGFDRITELLNAHSFKNEVKVLLESLDNSKCHTVLNIQVDDYDSIIENFGSSVTNLIMKDIANQLKAVTRSSDIIGRTGIDCFALFIPYTPNKTSTNVDLVKRLCEELRKTYYDKLSISASFGIAIYPYDGLTFDELMYNASLALCSARMRGNGCFEYFSKEIKERIEREKLELDKGFRPIFSYNNINKKELKIEDNNYKSIAIYNKNKSINDKVIEIFNNKYLLLNASNIDEAKEILIQDADLSCLICDCMSDSDYANITKIYNFKNNKNAICDIGIIVIVKDDAFDIDLYNLGINEVIREDEIEIRLEKAVLKLNAKRKSLELQNYNSAKAFMNKNYEE